MTRIEELERELELAKELLTVYKGIADATKKLPIGYLPDGGSRKWEPYRYHYPWWPQVFCETKERT